MMVLCILMCIPVKMAASDKITVKSNYNQGWGIDNTNFQFTTTDDGKVYTCELKNVTVDNIWFRIVKNDKEWGPDNGGKDLVLTDSYQQAFEGKTSGAFQITEAKGKTYIISWDNVNNKIKCEESGTGGGTTGGGTTGGTPVDWNTVTTNRLTEKLVYILRASISLVTSLHLIQRV